MDLRPFEEGIHSVLVDPGSIQQENNVSGVACNDEEPCTEQWEDNLDNTVAVAVAAYASYVAVLLLRMTSRGKYSSIG